MSLPRVPLSMQFVSDYVDAHKTPIEYLLGSKEKERYSKRAENIKNNWTKVDKMRERLHDIEPEKISVEQWNKEDKKISKKLKKIGRDSIDVLRELYIDLKNVMMSKKDVILEELNKYQTHFKRNSPILSMIKELRKLVSDVEDSNTSVTGYDWDEVQNTHNAGESITRLANYITPDQEYSAIDIFENTIKENIKEDEERKKKYIADEKKEFWDDVKSYAKLIIIILIFYVILLAIPVLVILGYLLYRTAVLPANRRWTLGKILKNAALWPLYLRGIAAY